MQLVLLPFADRENDNIVILNSQEIHKKFLAYSN